MPYVTSWERMAKEEGMKIGKERGVKIGEERGVRIGEERGLERGDRNARLEVAKQMMLENFPMATIVKLTGLPLNELTDLSASLSPKGH